RPWARLALDHGAEGARAARRLGRAGARRVRRGRGDGLRRSDRRGGGLRRPDRCRPARARLGNPSGLDGSVRTLTLRELNRAALAPELRKLGQRFVAGDAAELLARAHAFAAEPRTPGELREHLGSQDAWMRVRVEGHFVYVTPFDAARSVRAEPVDLVQPEEGAAHLVGRYLRAFGPASVADAASWSGLTVGAVRSALERLRLRRFRDERGRELVDLPGAPLPPAQVPAPVRLLPIWDNLLVAFKDR